MEKDIRKEAKVTIGGREIQLIYNMRAQMLIEKEMDTDFFTLQDAINKEKKCTAETVGALRILGNEGLRMAGETPDLTESWLLDHMKPAEMLQYRIAVMAAIIDGWMMETDNSDEEEQDETLNEIRKKNGSIK